MTTAVRIHDAIAYRVQRTARLLRKHFLDLGVQHGIDLTPEQWFVLNQVYEGSGKSQSELVDEIFADRPNITRIVAGLEARGLVARRTDPHDGRRLLVGLTAKGRAMHDAFAALVPQARATVRRGISDADLAVATRVLAAIEHNLT